jgi:hypothetical protein
MKTVKLCNGNITVCFVKNNDGAIGGSITDELHEYTGLALSVGSIDRYVIYPRINSWAS